jgi:L-alanine-DL-glutamate epimerase-like enolase superfamily enzyme
MQRLAPEGGPQGWRCRARVPRVVEVRARRVRAQLGAAFRIAYSSSATAETLYVETVLDDGTVGVGEAAPAPRVTGENLAAAEAYTAGAAAALRGLRVPEELDKALHIVHRVSPWLPAARNALESSLLAAAAAVLGAEEALLLGGGSRRPRLLTDYTVSIPPPRVLDEIRATGYSAALAEAVEYILGRRREPTPLALEAGLPLPRVTGFHALKVKLGTGDPGLDIALATAVAEAARGAKIRVDANQAWSPKTAARVIHRLEDALGDRLVLVEQPVPATTPLERLAELRRAAETPIALDEAVRSPGDIAHAAAAGAADVVNIKLAKIGGPLQAARGAAVAEAHGLEVMWGCMLETGAGIAHAAAAAAATGWTRIVDLDAPLFLKEDPGAAWAGYRATGGGVELEVRTPATRAMREKE